jgi:hypothetical protein
MVGEALQSHRIIHGQGQATAAAAAAAAAPTPGLAAGAGAAGVGETHGRSPGVQGAVIELPEAAAVVVGEAAKKVGAKGTRATGLGVAEGSAAAMAGKAAVSVAGGSGGGAGADTGPGKRVMKRGRSGKAAAQTSAAAGAAVREGGGGSERQVERDSEDSDDAFVAPRRRRKMGRGSSDVGGSDGRQAEGGGKSKPHPWLNRLGKQPAVAEESTAAGEIGTAAAEGGMGRARKRSLLGGASSGRGKLGAIIEDIEEKDLEDMDTVAAAGTPWLATGIALGCGGAAAAAPTTAKQPLTLVLFDDFDVLLDTDKGFLSVLLPLISESRSPIVMTGSSPVLPGPLANATAVQRLEVGRPEPWEVLRLLVLVCVAEGREVPLGQLQKIALQLVRDCFDCC